MIDPASEIVIDLRALRHNLDVLAARVAPSKVMVVVKNDAYGHGLIDVARTSVEAGISWIGALDLSTALVLREAGITSPTRIFAWLLDPCEDLSPAIDASIDLGISTVEQLSSISSSTAAQPARVHLKIDTGLHRNGATTEDWPGLVARAHEMEQQGTIEIVAVWTHIAEADEHEDSLSISRFNAAVEVARQLGVDAPLRHLAASAAGYARPDARFDLVRFGAFAYGLPPGDGPGAAQLGLRQVMALRARITAVETRPDGGRRASIDLGYADGISTLAPERAEVAIRGRRCTVVSPIGVDRTWIDVGIDDSRPNDVAVGDLVTLWGEGGDGEPTLQEWGNATLTMSEELVVRLNPLISRRFI